MATLSDSTGKDTLMGLSDVSVYITTSEGIYSPATTIFLGCEHADSENCEKSWKWEGMGRKGGTSVIFPFIL